MNTDKTEKELKSQHMFKQELRKKLREAFESFMGYDASLSADAWRPTGGFKVYLTYFKDTGKYYSAGEYVTDKAEMFEIFEEVRKLVDDRKLPGLVEGAFGFHVSIHVPDHPNAHPHLILFKQ